MESYEFPILHKGIYYWIVAQHQGRTLIIGPKITEEDANRMGFDKLDGNFDVVALPTRDRGKATSMIKARILDRTGDIDEATKRFRHNQTERR